MEPKCCPHGCVLCWKDRITYLVGDGDPDTAKTPTIAREHPKNPDPSMENPIGANDGRTHGHADRSSNRADLDAALAAIDRATTEDEANAALTRALRIEREMGR